MEVPYALSHAAVSTWLRTTGDAALVARWAGQSVAVLLKVYAKAVDGAEQESLDRIGPRHADTPKPVSGERIGNSSRISPVSRNQRQRATTQKVERPSQRTFDLVWQVLGSNQRRRCRQIYSLLPLATRATCHAARPRGVGGERKQ